jgi:hypothetical protein
VEASGTTEPTKRPFRTRWAVIAFVVIALVVCSVIMVMQLRGDPPDEADSGAPITTVVAGGRATVSP